jgi:ABC-type arginine transport system permease subunit
MINKKLISIIQLPKTVARFTHQKITETSAFAITILAFAIYIPTTFMLEIFLKSIQRIKKHPKESECFFLFMVY